MRTKSHPRIFCAANALLAGAFLLLFQSTLPSAVAQDPETPPMPPAAAPEPQLQPESLPDLPFRAAGQDFLVPSAKGKKVWTNDELESSRSPVDQYLMDKEASEAAAATQAAADAPLSKQFALDIKVPRTAEETQRAIDDTQQDISDEKDAIDRLNKEFEYAPDEQKAGIQREIDRHTSGVQTSEQQLKVLQDHLKQLNSESTGAGSPDSGKQTSQ